MLLPALNQHAGQLLYCQRVQFVLKRNLMDAAHLFGKLFPRLRIGKQLFKQIPYIKNFCLFLQHTFKNGVVLPRYFHGKDVAVEGVTDVSRNHTFQLAPRSVQYNPL